jgi:hypothetical protein
MKRQGMGLAGKLIIIFSALYALLLAGVLAMSIHFFIQAKERDAHSRVLDVINSIDLAQRRMDEEELGAQIS